MIKNSKSIPEKEAQKKEDFCPCGCVDQINKLRTENPLINKKTDKRKSCC